MLKLENNLSKHFYFVDFFRGVAALVVMIGHYQHFFYKNGYYRDIDVTLQPYYKELHFFYFNGSMAVKLFWVISGFVFATAYLTSEFPTLKSFFIKRFARLYPLHFVTLIIVAILQFICFKTTHYYQIYHFNDWYHFFLNLGLVSNWGFQRGSSFNAPIWSVSVEIFIYILFYCSLRFIKLAPVLATTALVLFFHFFVNEGSFLYPFKLCGFFFFFGVGVYVILNLFKKWNVVVLIVSGLIFASTIGMRHYDKEFGGSFLCLVFLLPSLILFLSSLDLLDTQQWGEKVKIVGDLSFSLYLCHVPMEILIILIVDNFGIDKSIYSSGLFLFCYIVSVISVSYCSYTYFELPMRNYFRSKSRVSVLVNS